MHRRLSDKSRLAGRRQAGRLKGQMALHCCVVNQYEAGLPNVIIFISGGHGQPSIHLQNLSIRIRQLLCPTNCRLRRL